MTEKRSVVIDGTPYSVTISSEQEVLSAAYAAGGAIVGLWEADRAGQCLAPAEYVAESMEAVDEEFLACIVRRRFHMPWIIAETERLLIREFTAEDADRTYCGEDGPDEEIFGDRSLLESYINSQYRFFGYGIWAVVEKKSETVIGRAGLFQSDWVFKRETALAKKDDTPLELGYHIFTPWRRLGYGAEACRAILSYGTKRLTDRYCAVIDEGNTASVRLAESLGFQLTAQRYSGPAGRQYLYVLNCS